MIKKIIGKIKEVSEKVNNEIKNSFKTKWDYIRFIICQLFVLMSIFILNSVLMILVVIFTYILIEYLINVADKADKTDDII